MTEESKNESSEEQELAQEALDATATDEQTPADEPTVPLHRHTALRTRAQAAELEAATLKGKLEGIAEAQTKALPAEKSPIELETARQLASGDIASEEDMTITPALLRKEKLFDRQVANAETKAAATKDLRIKQFASKRQAMTAHEDFDEVINAGQGHLTQGEIFDLDNAGVDFGELCYSKCKTAAERATPKAEPKPENPAPNKEKSESDAEKAAKAAAAKVVQSQTEILKDLEVDPAIEKAMSL